MAKVWARIRETIERHGIAGLVSVIDVAGSAPREAGARIVLQPDGGFFGTIGGGRLEYEAIAAARAALAAGRGRAAVPRLAARPQSRPMLRRQGAHAHRDIRCQRSATVRRFEEAEQAGAFVTMSRARRRRTDRARSWRRMPRPAHH